MSKKTWLKIALGATILLCTIVQSPARADENLAITSPANGATYTPNISSGIVQINVPGSYDMVFSWGTESGVYTSSQTMTTDGGTGNYGFSLDTPITTPGTYYFQAVTRDSGANVIDTSAEISANVSSEAPPTITIYNPHDGKTVPDFSMWVVNINAHPYDPLGTDYYTVSVQSQLGETAVSDTGYTTGDEGLQIGFAKTWTLADGNWTATAHLFDKDMNEVATSPTISFTIDSGAVPVPPTISCASSDTLCKIQNWFISSMSSLVNWLFQPSSTTLGSFGDLWDPVKNKVPFGYLTLTFTAFGNIFTSEDPAYTLPDVPVLDDISTIVGIALWALFGTYVIRRIGRMKI